tara:strand:- start:40158 stop:41207 length:1050 start_codon:yes stop_codon:yes gene_type:complete
MKKTILFLLIFQIIPHSNAATLRSEIDRYTILRDRAITDRQLKVESPYQEFFNLDIVASSGIRTIISDVKSGTETTNSAQKQLNMFQLLSKYVNSERYVDVDFTTGFPLFDIKFKKHHFMPSFFFNYNVGLMFTVSNQENALNPTGQLYLKLDKKIGIQTLYPQKKSLYQFAIYQMTRSDLLSSITSSSLATSGKLFNLDDLNKEQKTIAFDIDYMKKNARDFFQLAAKEVKLLSQTDHKSKYEHKPLLSARYGRFLKWEKIMATPFIGIHYRQKYSLHQGIFIGTKFESLQHPLELTAKLSNEFITLIPQVKFKYLRFNYTLKNPYRNPQKDVWVSSMHSLNLAIPFP